ncbi:MAG: hypothetical protein IJ011_03240 [Clostridia bacterium]|nr:hypothetical protein [Clostridia bacterium]
MGKSNRIRTNRASYNVKAVGVKNKKKGMPSWAMTLITVVVAVALLFSVTGILLSANGVFTRITTVVYSQNYKINANMMAYYYNTQYQNFVSNYSTYLSYGYFSLDTSKDLDEQPFGGAEDSTSTYYDEIFLGEFEGTWHDYFMNAAVESAKSILMYCEAAEALGVSLTEEDYKTIDENIASYEETATYYGYPSVSSFLSASFGRGVSEGDVRDCMEYSLLATKVMEVIAEQIDGSVTDDDVNSNYNDNKLDYNVIDYSYYSFKVTYDDVAEEVLGKEYETELKKDENKTKVLEEYKKQIEAAKAAADELNGKTNIDDFKAYIYNYVATEAVEDVYGDQTIKDDIKPDADVVAHIKAELVKAVVAEIVEGKEETTDVIEIKDDTADEVTIFDKTVSKDYAKIINDVKEDLFDDVLSAKTTYNVEKANYTKDNTFSEWAFDDARAANDMKLIAEYDGKDADAEVTNKEGKSHTSVYFLTATQYKDSETSKNMSYMVFSKEETAKAAIAELVANGTLTQEAFLAMAESKSATTSSAVTDYTEGSMGSTEFDEWLFDSERAAGDLTAEPIKTTSDSSTVYIVALYEGEGKELWYLDVKSVIVSERAEAKVTELEGKYPVTVKENKLDSVNVTA